MNTLARRVARVAVPVLVAASGLAACGSPDTTNSSSGSTQSGSAPTYRSPSSNAATPLAAQPPVAITHIHAIARDPKNGELLLATHEGLFLRSGTDLRQAGPVIDLMAFAIAPDGTFYASGHPGAEVDLPQPVGLIVSTDSGRTWQIASLGGQSDFHALAAGPSMVAGFDGDLRVTRDGKTWITRSIPAPPRTLAAAPKSGTLIATTQAGLLLSPDEGASWRTLRPPQPGLLAAWADDRTIVVATTSGQVATSSDVGATWSLQPKVHGVADALYAQRSSDDQVEIIVVVKSKVIRTIDNGATTEVLVG